MENSSILNSSSILNQSFAPSPSFIQTTVDNTAYLTTLLNQKTHLAQSQSTQISELKASLTKDVEIINKLDQSIPLEEKKIEGLQEENVALQNRFQLLQHEMNQYTSHEDDNYAVLRNTEQELLQAAQKQNEMRAFFEQTNNHKNDIEEHIKTLETSCMLLSNEIGIMKNDNISTALSKDHLNKMQNELKTENSRIGQLLERQKQMKEYLMKTEETIQELQGQNLDLEMAIYDETKKSEEYQKMKTEIDYQIQNKQKQYHDFELAKASLGQKETQLEREKEIYKAKSSDVRHKEKDLKKQQLKIQELKKSISKIETIIQKEKKSIDQTKNLHMSCVINTDQFSCKVDQSVREINKLKNKKKDLKKQLKKVQNIANELKGRVNSIENAARDLKRERLLIEKPIPSQFKSNDAYRKTQSQDETKRSLEMMRQQLEDLKNNRKRIQDIEYEHLLLEKRMDNFESNIGHWQNEPVAHFPSSRLFK